MAGEGSAAGPWRGGPGWAHFNIHDILRIRTNARLPVIPAYFHVEATEPNFVVQMLDDLPLPDSDRIRRVVGHAAYELGEGELCYECDVPILFLLGSRARWRFLLSGLAGDTARIATSVPFFRFAPVRYKATQLLSKLVLLIMTLRLIQRGFAMCHATTVAKDGLAHLLLGFGGTGKSTLATMLTEAGFEFLSDDYMIADPDGQVYCYPDHHKPRPMQARIPLSKYLGVLPPFERPDLRISPKARVGPVFIMERGPDRITEMDPEEALRRILLLNLEEISKMWNSPISGVLNHYAYFYPELDLEVLLERYRACVTSFVSHAGPFVSVQSSSPNFEILRRLILQGGGRFEV